MVSRRVLLSSEFHHSRRRRDIQDYQSGNKTMSASRVMQHHSSKVNDVQFHPQHGRNLYGSVSDDGTFQLFDLRTKSDNEATIRIRGHTDAVNALSFNPWHDFLVATGSEDRTVAVLDMRFPDEKRSKLFTFEGHADAVTNVEWSPHVRGVLASSSADRRVVFWDTVRVGLEQTPEDAEDGPPEKMFMHGGHTAPLSDIAWSPSQEWLFASVSDDNLLQVWRANKHLVEPLPEQVKTRAARRREVSADAAATAEAAE